MLPAKRFGELPRNPFGGRMSRSGEPQDLPPLMSQALSEQQRCVRGQHRSPNLKLRLGHKSMPLGQCGRASLLVSVTGDEMALLIEMVVELAVN